MEKDDDLTLLRVRTAFEMLGHKPSSGYMYVKDGLITDPVAYGPAGKRLPLGEIRRIAAARIAGASDDEIRALVQRLHWERKARASRDLAGDPEPPQRARRLRNAAEQARSEQPAATTAVEAHTPQPVPTDRRAPPKTPPKTKRTPTKRTPTKQETATA